MIQNPILPGFNPDPSIVRVGDDYYIATSTFEWYPGVQIHHSRDLCNWRLIARPLNRAALLDMRGDPDSGGIWAPCLTHHDGLFWLVYTDVKRHEGSFKEMHNYLTTCASIDGEWSDPVSLNTSGFDASLFHDVDGRKYLVNMEWDYRPDRHSFNGILLQEYDARQKKLVGPITNIFKGSDLRLTEAPHLYKRNGYYYLLTAEGGTGYNHAMTMARSQNLRGPYQLDPMKHLLTSKDDASLPLQRSGHGDWVETQHGDIYIVHLSGRPITAARRCPLGRETAIQKGYWSEDGWLRVAQGGNKPDYTVPSPTGLPLHPWPKAPARSVFNTASLPSEFQWLRIPWDETMFTLKGRPGFLRLYGHESIGSWFKQSLIARRQQAFRFTACTRMEFEPDSIQQQAGLICYYNAHKLHYLHVTCDDDGSKVLCIVSCEGQQQWNFNYPTAAARAIPLPRNTAVYLRAEVDFERLLFSWSLDGATWNTIDHVLDYSLISDEAGRGEGKSFTGAFVGVACHDLTGRRQAADFEWFEYVERDGAGEYLHHRNQLKDA